MANSNSGAARHAGVITVLIVYATCSTSLLGREPSPRRPLDQFEPARIEAEFRKRRNEARRYQVLRAARPHAGDVRVHFALRSAIELNQKRRTAAPSVLAAVAFYCEAASDTDFALSLTQSRDDEIAIVATATLTRTGVPGAVAALNGLSRRPVAQKIFGMRRRLVAAAATFTESDRSADHLDRSQPATESQKQAVDFLVEMHDRYDGQLRYENSMHLARVTGENFGGYPEEWKTWWAKNRATFTFAKAKFHEAAETQVGNEDVPWPHQVPNFFGHNLYSHRTLFVIDSSRSMESTLRGVTRMEALKNELERVIDQMPDGSYYNVISYHTRLDEWKPRLVMVDAKTRSEGKRFLEKKMPVGMTMLYDALAKSLKHDGGSLEAVVFLTDGKPTAGTILDYRTIVDEITRQNAKQQTSIYAVGIDSHGPEYAFLDELSKKNFGEFRVLR